MVTAEDPRLAQIRALILDEADGIAESTYRRLLEHLGAPPVDATPPQGRRAGTEFTPGHSMNVVERVTPPQGMYRDDRSPSGWSSVDVTPPQGIDRDALGALLDREGDLYDVDLGPLGPKILALVRPVEGVILTPGTLAAELAADVFLTGAEDRARDQPDAAAELRALAARLEAAQ